MGGPSPLAVAPAYLPLNKAKYQPLVFALSAGPFLRADELLIDPSDALNHLRESVTVSGLVVVVFVSKHGNAYDDDPYIVKAADGIIYKAEWYGGDSTWFQGDRVILPNDNGQGQMVSPDDDDKMTQVSVEEIDE